MSKDRAYLTAGEAAARLKISKTYFYNLRRQNKIPPPDRLVKTASKPSPRWHPDTIAPLIGRNFRHAPTYPDSYAAPSRRPYSDPRAAPAAPTAAPAAEAPGIPAHAVPDAEPAAPAPASPAGPACRRPSAAKLVNRAADEALLADYLQQRISLVRIRSLLDRHRRELPDRLRAALIELIDAGLRGRFEVPR